MATVAGSAHDLRGFSARQRGQLQPLQTRGHSHSGWGRHENHGTVHRRQSKSHSYAQGFLRPRRGSYPLYARRGPGKDSQLERREDYRTGRPALYRSAHRAAPRSANRLCPLNRRRPAVDTRPAPEELVLTDWRRSTSKPGQCTQNPLSRVNALRKNPPLQEIEAWHVAAATEWSR